MQDFVLHYFFAVRDLVGDVGVFILIRLEKWII